MLSLEQVAERIGLAVETLRHWRWRKRAGLRLPEGGGELVDSMVLVGRSVRVSEDALVRWLAQRRKGTKQAPGCPIGLEDKIRTLASEAEGEGLRSLAEALRGLAGLAETHVSGTAV